MLFMDLMFWKTPAVADQVNAGYFLKGDSEGLFSWKQVRGPAQAGGGGVLVWCVRHAASRGC
jgi:hypothetical protein